MIFFIRFQNTSLSVLELWLRSTKSNFSFLLWECIISCNTYSNNSTKWVYFIKLWLFEILKTFSRKNYGLDNEIHEDEHVISYFLIINDRNTWSRPHNSSCKDTSLMNSLTTHPTQLVSATAFCKCLTKYPWKWQWPTSERTLHNAAKYWVLSELPVKHEVPRKLNFGFFKVKSLFVDLVSMKLLSQFRTLCNWIFFFISINLIIIRCFHR